MVTIVLYFVSIAVAVAVVFAVVWLVFGRGEELPPIEKGTTLTRLPRAGITGDDVRSLIFAQKLRGYSTEEVDWVLEKLAREVDELRAALYDLQGREPDVASPAVVVDASRER